MDSIASQDLPQFLRRYRFAGGRISSVRVGRKKERGMVVEFQLKVSESIRDLGTEPKAVRLKMVLESVEEYRFQMRPNLAPIKIANIQLLHLNGLFYLAFDGMALDPGERPKVHDFRASEVYAAGRALLVAEIA